MATIDRQLAVNRLAQAVRDATPDYLADIYNELFPQSPTTEDEARMNPSAVLRKIMAHFDGGLEVEEILDLWHVMFPANRRLWFNEVDGLIYYDEKTPPDVDAV